MHHALLLDEILRLVFYSCLEDAPPTLISAALTCKAWMVPALDIAWRRLYSVRPLLSLIPGIEVINNEYRLQDPIELDHLDMFNRYATRVHSLICRDSVKVHSSVVNLLGQLQSQQILPVLETVFISTPLHSLLCSPSRLKKLDFDLGFRQANSNSKQWASDFMWSVAKGSPELEELQVRGSASPSFVGALYSLSNLQVLRLRMGSSLAPELFSRIANFPLLHDLEVHAGHLQVQDLEGLNSSFERPIFPSLKRLNIRASHSFIEFLLKGLPRNVLTSVRMDITDETVYGASWIELSSLLSRKTRLSLQELAIEHLVEKEHLEGTLTPASAVAPNQSQSVELLPILEKLADLCQLRAFAFELSLPLTVNDSDVDKVAKWWPHLQTFSLIPSTSSLPEVGTHFTSSCFNWFSGLQHLKMLTLPVDLEPIEDIDQSQVTPNYDLETLILVSASLSDPKRIATYVHRLFPSLLRLDAHEDHDENTEQLQEHLLCLRQQPNASQ